jgi:GDP-4-dehydro-6-deoxy-D-mannose reductase
MKQILVTGVNGFVGHHLAQELHAQGIHVIGTDRQPELSERLESVVGTYIGGCDLTSPESVAALPLDRVDAVINLAGFASVGDSFDAAEECKRTNVAVHAVMADRLAELGQTATRILAISTGAVYDNYQPMPLNEDSELVASDPKLTSPYTISKIAMEEALLDRAEHGLNIVIVRPFNHIGPGQRGEFLVPRLVEQVASGNTVVAGDLTTERDYTDVRDVVKAYVALATSPDLQHRLYNVCSGRSISGEAMLDKIEAAFGKSDVTVEVNPKLVRENDPRLVIGDCSRLRDDTGWTPSIPLNQTIEDIVASL